MKRSIVSFMIAIMLSGTAAHAQLAPAGAGERPQGLGVGLEFGQLNGLTANYFLSRMTAVDVAAGWDGPFTAHADFLWVGWKALPQPKVGRLPVYVGVGGEIVGDDAFLRTVGGIAYFVAPQPVEIFFELAPTFGLSYNDFDLDAQIGVRYYFSKFN